MTNREITTLMHRLFDGDLGPADYVHLMVDDKLDRARVNALLAHFIPGEQLLIFVTSNHCTFSNRTEAFEKIEQLMQLGRVIIADPKFHGHVMIEPLGVGVGLAL